MPAELRTAATVILLREDAGTPEVLMLRRHERAAFMAGAFVFPGGAVDASDGQEVDSTWCDGLDHAVRQLPGVPAADALAFHVAATRELFEEAGVLLARDPGSRFVRFDAAAKDRFDQHRATVHGGTVTLRDMLRQEHLRIAMDALTSCAHWVTPPVDTRRFDTRFFLAPIPETQQPAHDDRETTESLWVRPADAIGRAIRREIVLPPPTWVMLRELAPFTTLDAIVTWARRRVAERREPAMAQVDGRRALVMQDGADPDRAPEDWFVWRDDRWLPRDVA